MMRKRLRPAYTTAELAALYAVPHDHTRWRDHLIRVDTTIQVAKWMLPTAAKVLVADLSCGDGAILDALNGTYQYRGDYAPRYRYTGPIESTITHLAMDVAAEHATPFVDLFVCSETIEHLDDPDTTLARIRKVTDTLVVSTPIGEDNDGNPEHYWGWDTEAVEDMLRKAGFVPDILVSIRLFHYPYDYQVWGCR